MPSHPVYCTPFRPSPLVCKFNCCFQSFYFQFIVLYLDYSCSLILYLVDIRLLLVLTWLNKVSALILNSRLFQPCPIVHCVWHLDLFIGASACSENTRRAALDYDRVQFHLDLKSICWYRVCKWCSEKIKMANPLIAFRRERFKFLFSLLQGSFISPELFATL